MIRAHLDLSRDLCQRQIPSQVVIDKLGGATQPILGKFTNCITHWLCGGGITSEQMYRQHMRERLGVQSTRQARFQLRPQREPDSFDERVASSELSHSLDAISLEKLLCGAGGE